MRRARHRRLGDRMEAEHPPGQRTVFRIHQVGRHQPREARIGLDAVMRRLGLAP
jgi:hypothetical protein